MEDFDNKINKLFLEKIQQDRVDKALNEDTYHQLLTLMAHITSAVIFTYNQEHIVDAILDHYGKQVRAEIKFNLERESKLNKEKVQ